jgi:hypothetical protein
VAGWGARATAGDADDWLPAGFAEAEVAAPSNEIDRQLLGDLREALPARAPRQFLDSALEARNRLRRDAPSRLLSACEAEAQELACARFGDRVLGVSGAVETQIVVEAETIFDVPANGIYYANLVAIGVPIIPPTNRNSAKLLP